MADGGDRSQELEEQEIERALKYRERPAGPQAIGECLYCGDPLEDGRRWCDADCRDDWQRYRVR